MDYAASYSPERALNVACAYLLAILTTFAAQRYGVRKLRTRARHHLRFYNGLGALDGQQDKKTDSNLARHESDMSETDDGDMSDFGDDWVVESKHHRTGTFAYHKSGQFLKYNHNKAISLRILFVLKHSVLCTPSIANRILVFIGIATAMFVVDFLLFWFDVPWFVFNINYLDSIVDFLRAFVAILLGFYLSIIISRWQSVRMDSLGRCWGAIDDLMLLISAHFPGEDWKPIRQLVLRYALVSFELMFMQAQGCDHDLQHLVGRRLLTADEAESLACKPSRPQVVWTWIASLFHQLYSHGHMCNIMLARCYEKCTDARGGIGAVFGFLDTQLPFMYVQLLAWIVHVSTVVASLHAGICAAHYVFKPKSEDPMPIPRLTELWMQAFFYNACLEIGAVCSEPLGTAFENFPRHAFLCYMHDECKAFDDAGSDQTNALHSAANISKKLVRRETASSATDADSPRARPAGDSAPVPARGPRPAGPQRSA